MVIRNIPCVRKGLEPSDLYVIFLYLVVSLLGEKSQGLLFSKSVNPNVSYLLLRHSLTKIPIQSFTTVTTVTTNRCISSFLVWVLPDFSPYRFIVL